MTPEGERPAFYALPSGGWRDYVTLLHPPYTLWHLSYVVIGACTVADVNLGYLAWSVLAFFGAVGLGAHALDELNGRPLRTAIPSIVLVAIAFVGLTGAVVLGVYGAVIVSPWMLWFIVIGAFIALAYNLEWFHGDVPFGPVVRTGLGCVPRSHRCVRPARPPHVGRFVGRRRVRGAVGGAACPVDTGPAAPEERGRHRRSSRLRRRDRRTARQRVAPRNARASPPPALPGGAAARCRDARVGARAPLRSSYRQTPLPWSA